MNKKDLQQFIKLLELMVSDDTDILQKNYLKENSKVYPKKELINPKKLDSYISKANKIKNARLTNQTFAIINLKEKYYPYKTLMLQLNDDPIISIETTSVIMKKSFELFGISYDQYYDWIKLIQKETIYRMPYVYSGKMYMPVNGPTRQSSTWYAVHFVTQYHQDNKYGDITLTFDNHIDLQTNLTKESFEKQLQRCVYVNFIQENGSKSIAKKLLDIDYFDKKVTSDSLVSKKIKELDFHNYVSQEKCEKFVYALGLIKMICEKDSLVSEIYKKYNLEK